MLSDIDPSDTSGDVLFLSNIISTATRERTPTDIVVCITFLAQWIVRLPLLV